MASSWYLSVPWPPEYYFVRQCSFLSSSCPQRISTGLKYLVVQFFRLNRYLFFPFESATYNKTSSPKAGIQIYIKLANSYQGHLHAFTVVVKILAPTDFNCNIAAVVCYPRCSLNIVNKCSGQQHWCVHDGERKADTSKEDYTLTTIHYSLLRNLTLYPKLTVAHSQKNKSPGIAVYYKAGMN